MPYHWPMSQEPLTEAIQHYLREIYKLGPGREPVAVGALARAQGVSAASASAMVKKLTALDLAEHPPYRGVSLTPAGERVALEVIRHHRLLELYLAETLGVHVDDVHDEADRLEHANRQGARLPDARSARGSDPRRKPRVAARDDALARDYMERPKNHASSGFSTSSRVNGLQCSPRPSRSETVRSSSSAAFACSSASSSSYPSKT